MDTLNVVILLTSSSGTTSTSGRLHFGGSLSDEFGAGFITDGGNEGLEVLSVSRGTALFEEVGDLVGGYYKKARLGCFDNTD